MKFRTEYIPPKSIFQLSPEESVVLLGSCFTANIGSRMRSCRWSAYPNPCGTLFNPRSISNILRIAFSAESIPACVNESLTQRDELWMSWLTDSSSTSFSREETKERVWNRLLRLNKLLPEARTLIITFGTSWIYKLKEKPGYVVSNCHKFPADTFIRRRLSVNEIVAEWKEVLGFINKEYPEMKVIFTVSPVRHLKDGFEGNSRSKAILQLACEEICASNEKATYFPAFEIMNDDLRDYRFYASDLTHPSEEAVEYIWNKFQQSFLSEKSRQLLQEGEKITKRLNHRPIIYGNSMLAQHHASRQEREALDAYNKFIAAHPTMLYIDE